MVQNIGKQYLPSFFEGDSALLDLVPYEIMCVDEAGKIVFANTKFCERLGYNLAEITTLSIFKINTSTTKESWLKHWEIVKKDKINRFKSSHQTRGGSIYDVEVTARFFSNKGKELIFGVINDITHSSFYQNLLTKTEFISGIGGWKLNLQDKSIIATEEALKIFNLENKDDIHPRKLINFFKEKEKFQRLNTKLIINGEAFDEIFETTESPKRFIKVIGEPKIKNKKVYKVFGTYQDVTEQKTKEIDLKLYKVIIDNAEDLIYLYDRGGKLLHYSNSVIEKLGFTKEELERFTIFDLDPQMSKEWWQEHFNDIIEKGSVNLEWIVLRKDGTRFSVDITANHLTHDGIDLNCAIVRDISDRKKRDLELFEALQKIKRLNNKIKSENVYLQEQISKQFNSGKIISASKAYENVLKQVSKVAPTETTVLITGESGTGKELIAIALHENSHRNTHPLIKINCATLPKELIESELFGHKKGAFTGAVAERQGKFKLADGGTVFLDEIGELPVEMQAKLLRVLQEGEYDEIGGTKTIKVNVRIIAATNRDLEKMMHEGSFREDLYYRLNVFPIYSIPLRERKEDIPLLTQFFLDKYALKVGKVFNKVTKTTLDALMAYSFPGNIRELENLIERAVIIEEGPSLSHGTWLPSSPQKMITNSFKPFDDMQKEYIVNVLDYTNWRVSGDKGAAVILGLNAKTLFAKMKKLSIEKKIIQK